MVDLMRTVGWFATGAGLNARHKPDIGFAPDTEDMVFCATTPKLPTSKLQSNQQISVSSTRLRRFVEDIIKCCRHDIAVRITLGVNWSGP